MLLLCDLHAVREMGRLPSASWWPAMLLLLLRSWRLDRQRLLLPPSWQGSSRVHTLAGCQGLPALFPARPPARWWLLAVKHGGTPLNCTVWECVAMALLRRLLAGEHGRVPLAYAFRDPVLACASQDGVAMPLLRRRLLLGARCASRRG